MGDDSQKICFISPSEKGSTLKGYSFRVDPFSEGGGVQESKQRIIKVVSLEKHGRTSTKCISPFNCPGCNMALIHLLISRDKNKSIAYCR